MSAETKVIMLVFSNRVRLGVVSEPWSLLSHEPEIRVEAVTRAEQDICVRINGKRMSEEFRSMAEALTAYPSLRDEWSIWVEYYGILAVRVKDNGEVVEMHPTAFA